MNFNISQCNLCFVVISNVDYSSNKSTLFLLFIQAKCVNFSFTV